MNAPNNTQDAMAAFSPATGSASVLDMCCGPRMMWFDKDDERAVFLDRRREREQARAINSTLEAFVITVTDQTTAITTGTAKLTIPYWPYDFRLVEIVGGLTTVQGSGNIFTVDVNKNGTTMLSTKLTIDNSETTSKTAATPAVISVASITEDDVITVDIDAVGTGGAGLKLTFMGVRA
mgnify:CR=1 FL=1